MRAYGSSKPAVNIGYMGDAMVGVLRIQMSEMITPYFSFPRLPPRRSGSWACDAADTCLDREIMDPHRQLRQLQEWWKAK